MIHELELTRSMSREAATDFRLRRQPQAFTSVGLSPLHGFGIFLSLDPGVTDGLRPS